MLPTSRQSDSHSLGWEERSYFRERRFRYISCRNELHLGCDRSCGKAFHVFLRGLHQSIIFLLYLIQLNRVVRSCVRMPHSY
ncbi:hypothetical protein ACHAXS_010198 [Conticribra weissflogii]